MTLVRDQGTAASLFDIDDASSIYLIGGGGKTSLMFTLARDLVGLCRRVVTTTTTHIVRPPEHVSPHLIVEDNQQELEAKICHALQETSHVTAASAYVTGTQIERFSPAICTKSLRSGHMQIASTDLRVCLRFLQAPEHQGLGTSHPAESLSLGVSKLRGFSPEIVDRFGDYELVDHVIVEADGAAGRSLKAHKSHEPVVSAQADVVILVIGVDCVGQRLVDANVHRAQLFAEILDRPLGCRITASDVAAIVVHRQGYLRRIAERSRVMVMLNKVDGPEDERTAEACSAALRLADVDRRIERIVIGSLGGLRRFLRVSIEGR